MNAPQHRAETTALSTGGDRPAYELTTFSTDAASLILGPSFERVQVFAGMMCKGSVTVPRHLIGNIGDCMAVTMQALGWRMNPFAVAQKTHVSQSGQLGYEAQLVSAVISGSGALKGDPEYEHIGDWDKVLGKVEERKSDKGGKYYVATYTKADEQGLGVIVRATLAGESKPREMTVMMSQAYPRFSTQWATDPKQQICYLAIRKWARLHKPGVILGVYTNDELDDGNPPEKFMGPADVVQPTGAAAPTDKKFYPEADFKANLPTWQGVIEKGRKTGAQIIAMAHSTGKGELTHAQQATLLSIKSKVPAQDQAADATPKPQADADPFTAPTFAEVAPKLSKSANLDELNVAGDLIKAVADEGHRTELQALFNTREAELKA